MQDVVLVKDVGHVSIVEILNCLGTKEYASEFLGVSSGYGPSSNQLAMHLDDAADDTDAVAALAAAALPTCSSSLLDITVNVGTWIVSDVTSIVADPTEIKTVKASVLIDDTTGALEVHAFEKTTGEYGAVPAGKTLCTDLKEYTLAAAGSALVEAKDFIQ